jgi:hypothetical protein
MRAMISRMVSVFCGVCVSEIIPIAPQRSHSMYRNQLGNARSDRSRTSAGVGSGSVP